MTEQLTWATLQLQHPYRVQFQGTLVDLDGNWAELKLPSGIKVLVPIDLLEAVKGPHD